MNRRRGGVSPLLTSFVLPARTHASAGQALGKDGPCHVVTWHLLAVDTIAYDANTAFPMLRLWRNWQTR